MAVFWHAMELPADLHERFVDARHQAVPAAPVGSRQRRDGRELMMEHVRLTLTAARTDTA